MNEISKYSKYIIKYPGPDEEGFDGIHYGGFKCLTDDAPDYLVKFFKELEEANKEGVCL